MPATKPTLIYDGDCRFCCKWVERLRTFAGDRVTCRPFQECAQEFPQIVPELFNQSVHLVQPDGSFCSAAHAALRSMALRPEGKPLLWLYRHMPFFSTLSEKVYRWVASHREVISAVDRALTGLTGVIPTYSTSSWFFLRGLALVFLIAFTSFWSQASGLIGENGILPAQTTLQQLFQQLGSSAFLQLPTLFWFGASDGMLYSVCALGTVISLLALCGWGGATAYLVMWFLYLSLVGVGGPFLAFQWDNLLLEAGLLAVFFAPWQFQTYKMNALRPSVLGRWLVLFLLFRLMFASGVVKLASGDPTWANLTALQFHYETQPLPTTLAYFVHQLPATFQRFSAFLMFIIELVIPFFIFAPRRLQLLASAAFLLLQGIIAATGNYCFFNLLTGLLCLLLIDDITWKRWTGNRLGLPPSLKSVWRFPSWVLAPYAAIILLSSTIFLSIQLLQKNSWPDWACRVCQSVTPLRSVNHYGLFSVMTTSRPEIVIEGSNDGSLWLEYRFKWKPGDVKSAPAFVQPHQPRLDWQMWFAALGTYQQNPWLIRLGEKLLQGSPEVLALLAENPYPNHPPKFIRAVVYDYHFTNISDLSKTGQWWTATYKGIYLPPVSLRDSP